MLFTSAEAIEKKVKKIILIRSILARFRHLFLPFLEQKITKKTRKIRSSNNPALSRMIKDHEYYKKNREKASFIHFSFWIYFSFMEVVTHFLKFLFTKYIFSAYSESYFMMLYEWKCHTISGKREEQGGKKYQ